MRLLRLSIITASIFAFSAQFAKAEENSVSHYIFGMHRINWAKMGVDNVSHAVESNNSSAKAFFPDILKHQIYSLKNISRMDKDAIGYGGWNKDYRQIMGIEYDYKRNRGGKSNYDYRDHSGSLFLMGDKAFLNKTLRLGGGTVFTRFSSDYTDSLANYTEDSALGLLYAVYNDRENQLMLRSRIFGGLGSGDIKRKTLNGIVKSDMDSLYYGTAHALTKTFSYDRYFLQLQAELNGFGVDRGKIKEKGGYHLNSDSSFVWENVLEAFVGFKQNGYSFKIGPSLTTVLTDPYDSFEAFGNDDNIFFSAKRDERDSITWKAYLTYKHESGVGFYSDVRYYRKDDPNMSLAIGINYEF